MLNNLGLPNEASSILVYRESGIVPTRLLIKKGNSHTASKSIQRTVHRVQETQKDPSL